MKDEIKNTVINIANILSSNDELSWASAFSKLGSELDTNYDESLRSLKSLYGGMGSFNDIVLHKDGIPLIVENDELDALRHILYEQLDKAMNSQKRSSDLT